VIAAYLLDERRVETIEDAQRFLQLLRPGVALNGAQLRRLREFEISLADTTEHQENRN
jgi:protein-tyrosine phosphatase